MGFQEPGTLILLSAVIGFIGTVSFTFALLFLNRRILPKLIPPAAAPGRVSFWLLLGAAIVYLLLAIAYFGTILGVGRHPNA